MYVYTVYIICILVVDVSYACVFFGACVFFWGVLFLSITKAAINACSKSELWRDAMQLASSLCGLLL